MVMLEGLVTEYEEVIHIEVGMMETTTVKSVELVLVQWGEISQIQ